MTHLELSREDAEALAAVIESTLSDLRYEISNTDSLDFRETLKAVLLGTRSFWEGVDVPGEALSCLMLTKLPFAFPSDSIFVA